MKYLLALLLIFNVADAILTNNIIKFDVGRETNPFLLGIVGQPAFVILKIVGVLLCGLILWDVHRRHPRLALISTSIFAAAYGFIVFWNLRILMGWA